jgi:hypothetical protein
VSGRIYLLRATVCGEPLIDPATFQRIQEALRANQRRTQGHPKRDYLLRGLLKCKHCGKSISGLYNRKSYRRKDGCLWTGGSRHYVCNGYQNHHDTALPQRCVLRYINAEALEAAIWAEIEKVLTNPAFLRQALTMNVEETLESLPRLKVQAARLQEQITDAEKKERRALELALSLNDMSMDTLKGMVTEIQREKRGWQEEHDRLTWWMTELTATAERLRDVDEQINAIIASVCAHMYDQDRRAILELFIKRIWVEHDGTEGRYASEIEGVLPTDSLVSSVSTVVTATTPATLELKRNTPHVLAILKDSYRPETVNLSRVISGAVAGNIIAGGLIGWGVDAATGAQYRLIPDTVHLTLTPEMPVVSVPRPPSSLEDRLREVETLHSQGLISPTEAVTRRQKLLVYIE